MNFTFVTHKGARPEKSELVKSHVMRESQRKRREAKHRRNRLSPGSRETTTPPDTSDPSALVPTTTDSVGVLTLPRQSETSLFDFSPFDDNESSREGMHAGPSPIDYNLLNFVEPPALGDVGDIRFTFNDDIASPFRPASATTTNSNTLQAFVGHFGALQSIVPTADHHAYASDQLFAPLILQPSLLHTTLSEQNSPSDPAWMRESLFERVVEVAAYYGNTYLVERPGYPPVNPCMFWQQMALSNPRVLLTCALFYCAYRDVVRGETGDDHHYFKAKALQLINDAMQDPRTAVADDNISSVLGLTMYENIHGSDLMVTHFQGLRQMIDMRGGINSLPSEHGEHLKEMTLMQDYLHAICSNVPPVMVEIDAPTLRHVRGPGIEYFYPQSPLRIINDCASPPMKPELQLRFELVKYAFDAFEMLCIEAFDPDTAAEDAKDFQVRRDAFWDMLMRDEREEIPSNKLDKVQEAIRLACKIHFRAVVLRTQHEDARNENDTKKLHEVIRMIDNSFWKVGHYIYVWILLTGGAASCNYPDHRPYFVSEIMRLSYSIGLYDWRVYRQILGNFLWLQHFLRREKSRSRSQSAGLEQDGS
ncbi:hypothetical protein EJ04DRAFT_570977 [Polyplosphaeria fusca]|uniref:Uncharacterized protein n=1 Tax=Polyplosphaeria fusca TaxID=682080 RepID=A0A9P4QJP8_9PLEO|nr:hypothetical protein EJ04DRAFT_570977 [Polyplosphaeria fusca]